MGYRIKIAIIDSGINQNHTLLKKCYISENSIAIHYKDNQIFLDKKIEDKFGHGTAVCGIITKLVTDVEFTIIKIFDYADLRATEEQMIAALDYIIEKVDCDIVHMSLGIVTCSEALHRKCQYLKKQGIILVAAYDNAGAISYPAAFHEVIGVDSDIRCVKAEDFFLVENEDGKINIWAKGGNHRLAWIDPPYIISQGASFSAAYISSYIANLLLQGIEREEIKNELKKKAKKYLALDKAVEPNLMKIPFQITRAAIFPYNKEMHSLINYADKLQFEIAAICDSKYTGRVGKKISGIYGNNTYCIMDIYDIDWSEIDTLILGHVNELEAMSSHKIKDEVIKICLENHVNIYSFDNDSIEENSKSFEANGLNVYVPMMENVNYLQKYSGRLFQIRKPVIGIFGTSSKQGKFTLQLALRYSFMQLGYEVCQMGTEPSALLFGFDACFPFGYNSTIRVEGEDFVLGVNKLMYDIDINRPNADLMIVGAQSGTTPMLYNNIGQFPIHQLLFLMGVEPDAVVLCINPDDPIDYIERTIKSIEGVGDCEVIALALYPLSYLNGWQLMNNIKKKIDNLEEIKRRLESELHLKVFVIGYEEDTEKLRDKCIEYLSGQ